jgi:AcrR family transcriptional regulator
MMPKGFTEQEKQIISTRLLEQGYRLFSVYGLKKTNVEELARAAGISKGAFYNFYVSKEALFMDVIEQVEIRVRQDILVLIDLPGPSPRARLVVVLKKAFSLFKTMPILQFFTGSDFDLLFRRIPAEKLQQHLASDRLFFDELLTRCHDAGIPIRAPSEQIVGLLYTLVTTLLHQEDLAQNPLAGSTDLLLELIAAYCLGEIEIQPQSPAGPISAPDEGNL